MIKRGFATLTVTLVLCAVAILAVFYFGNGVLFKMRKVKDDVLYYEASNAAHSGMTTALKIITDNSKKLPCLSGSQEVKSKGTINGNCYCNNDAIDIKDGEKVSCVGAISFKSKSKQDGDTMVEYTATIQHNKKDFYDISSVGRSFYDTSLAGQDKVVDQGKVFESVLRTVYQSVGGMKSIPKSAIVATGSVDIIGSVDFNVKNGSAPGGSIETGVAGVDEPTVEIRYEKYFGKYAPEEYHFQKISYGEKIIGISSNPPAKDTTQGVSSNSSITVDNKASAVYLGDEFMKSKDKFLNMSYIKDEKKRCQSVIASLSDAKGKGKLDKHVWLDLDAESIHEFTPHGSHDKVWGCELTGGLPIIKDTDEPLNIVINLVGLPDVTTNKYKDIIENGLTIYTGGGGRFRGMISFIDSVKNKNLMIRFKTSSSVAMDGTILLDNSGKALFEGSFDITYDSKLLDSMSNNLKSQGIVPSSWSDY